MLNSHKFIFIPMYFLLLKSKPLLLYKTLDGMLGLCFDKHRKLLIVIFDMRKFIAIALLALCPSFSYGQTSSPANYSNKQELKLQSDDYYLGNKNAPVTFIEYSSLSCPHCGEFHKTTYNQIKKLYIDTGKVLYIYRPMPSNQPALLASMLLYCVDSSKYFDYLDTLMNSQSMWAYHTNYRDSLINIAKLGGMNDRDVNACFQNKMQEDTLLKKAMTAASNLQIEHTPTFFINGNKMAGNIKFEEIKKTIDDEIFKAERAKKKPDLS